MTEFPKNTIIVAIAAFLAFLFAFILEYIKRALDARQSRHRSRTLVQLSLRSTQKILEAIKTRYQQSDFFDFIYLGQLKEMVAQLDRLRFSDRFFNRPQDQSSYFDAVSRLSLLAANMESIEQYKNNATLTAPGKDKFIGKKEQEFMSELAEINQKIDTMLSTLET